MLTKDLLRQEFGKNWQKYYRIEMFGQQGYERKLCKTCGRPFWTCDSDRVICADTPCVEYGFINDTITKKKWDYVGTWQLFEKYFKKNGHTPIPRYPVVDRWRPDLYFTIASIQDFQRLDNGNMNFVYPANPLIVPQVCLRFPDIQNVGITGKHLTSFVMSGQHTFGYPKEKNSYFKDRCIELNFGFLNGEMGIPAEELIYKEDIWAMPDFSAFGPCMETFSRGLELVNSVFMQYQKEGDWFRDLDMKVIDVGWGHERLVWFSNGTPASYDSLFGPVTDRLKKKAGVKIDQKVFDKYSKVAGSLDLGEVKDIVLAKKKVAEYVGMSPEELREKIEPLQAIYAIADHTRTLLFAITDGGIPSNVGGGYNLRVVLRRSFAFMDEFGLDFDLGQIARWHADYLKPMFPELQTELEGFDKIIELERGKFDETKKKMQKTITSLVDKGTVFDEATLSQLYESQGITPEEIKKFKPGFETPPTFYERITEKHSSLVEEKAGGQMITGVPATEKLCYSQKLEFEATVIKIVDDNVVLDKTAFYATSGGQDHDIGTLGTAKVLETFKQGEVILHKVDAVSKFKVGEKVKGVVDTARRKQLAQNHSAVHLVNGAARAVLGNHVWQAGSEVKVNKARLDITHYSAVTKEQQKEIEDLVNKKIKEGLKIEKPVVERGKAEQTYGFRVYQGGAIPQKELRIIKMGDFDVEACGGTHCDNTKEIGQVKILRANKIQDGVVRLEFVAGEAAKEAEEDAEGVYSAVLKPLAGLTKKKFKYSEDEMIKAAAVFSVRVDQLPQTIERFVLELGSLEDKISAFGGEVPESGIGEAADIVLVASLLFSEWKQRQRMVKDLLNARIQEEAKALPADNPKIRGVFFSVRAKDLEENPRTPVAKTIEKVKKFLGG